jgi:hypothetical protein
MVNGGSFRVENIQSERIANGAPMKKKNESVTMRDREVNIAPYKAIGKGKMEYAQLAGRLLIGEVG